MGISIFTQSNVRGFQVLNFKDAYGEDCSIQRSSAIDNTARGWNNPGTSYLWLGINKIKAKVMATDAKEVGVTTDQITGWVDYPIPEEVLLSSRMHLSRGQVKELISVMQQWLDNGTLSNENL